MKRRTTWLDDLSIRMGLRSGPPPYTGAQLGTLAAAYRARVRCSKRQARSVVDGLTRDRGVHALQQLLVRLANRPSKRKRRWHRERDDRKWRWYQQWRALQRELDALDDDATLDDDEVERRRAPILAKLRELDGVRP